MTSARRDLGELLERMAGILDDVQPLAATFLQLVARCSAAKRKPTRDDLTELREPISAVLREQRHWVAGAGLVVTPGVLAGTQRWLEWWWMRESGLPEALRVNLDETSADFFDYTNAEWYAVPAATGRRHAAGPYVDHLCTNQYSVTLTSPVFHGDSLVGVVGADVLVASIEAMVLPVLARIGPDAALVTAEGRVIASATPRWAPGYRVDTNMLSTRPVLPQRRAAIGGLRGWLVAQAVPPRAVVTR